MNADNRIDDYWTEQSTAPETLSKPHLNIEIIQGIEPLGAQFSVDTPKSVPEGVHEPLFGQVDPTQFELEQVGGDLVKVPLLQTYAILDAAKIPGLPELLIASGLEHRCLFQGGAYEELKDVAPWIVRLEESNNLTRNLFTRSGAGWHLWDDEPGIYLRSRGTLDEMWGHFRKFTRVQDEQGKWFYFRFWEPILFQTLAEGDFQCGVVNGSFFKGNSIVIVDPFLGCIVGITAHSLTVNTKPSRFGDGDFRLLKQFSRNLGNRKIASLLQGEEGKWSDFSGVSAKECLHKVTAAVEQAHAIGLKKPSHLKRFVKMCEEMGEVSFGTDPFCRTISAGHTPARLIAELEFDVKDLMKESA